MLLMGCKQKNLAETASELQTEQQKAVERIVSLNGTLTEIIAALGYQKQLVGVDVTSTYPTNIGETTENLDHVFKLSVEKLINLKPTKVFALEKEVRPELLQQLNQAGIQVLTFNQTYSQNGTKQLIDAVANALQAEQASAIKKTLDVELAQIEPITNAPKVLFIYARTNQMMVGGTGTPIEAVVELAGGKNAITEFVDYKPLTPEALAQANPDFIVMFDKGLEAVGGIDGLLKVDGIAQTNAGKNKNIIALDGLLLSGFGPRLGQAVQELNHAFKK
ncbi:heme/hemin ABC transporter substrate-binding protein [Flavobacterium agricola]|nr:ABC transporter substrate-binding protein [Flavobacterium agricola]